MRGDFWVIVVVRQHSRVEMALLLQRPPRITREQLTKLGATSNEGTQVASVLGRYLAWHIGRRGAHSLKAAFRLLGSRFRAAET